VKVKFEAVFAKDLKSIREKALLKRITRTIDEVKKDDNINQINSLKKLKGYDTFYRIEKTFTAIFPKKVFGSYKIKRCALE